MRIAGNLVTGFLNEVNHLREQSDVAEKQLSSGVRVQLPSDDPASAAALIGNRSQSSMNDQFSRNLSGLQATVQAQDSALNSVVLALNQAIALGTQGASGTVSAEDRLALSQRVSDLRAQLVDLANSSLNGIYLFAGTAVTGQPYAVDPSAAAGVTYSGTGTTTTVDVAPGETLNIFVPGAQIFSDPAGDVFQTMQDLATALQSGGDAAAATLAVKKALDHVGIQRVSIGSTLARLGQAGQSLSVEKLQLSQQENDLIGADLTQAATNFTHAQTALSAALQAGGKLSQLSLLDFLR